MTHRESDTRTWLASVALACALHVACVAYFASRPAHAAQPKRRQLEVTMLAPELAPPPAPLPAPPAPLAPERQPPKAARAPARVRVKPAAPPAPARAGALLTAPEPSPSPAAEEPVRFVTDSSGRGYGSGMVARGGNADHAPAAAVAPEPVRPLAGPRAGLVFADKLSRQPSLGAYDPCRGHFPHGASSDRGEVSVIATVRDQGSIARLEIESESPEGQGFGAAARACLTKQRFEPALDDAGKPTAARTRVRIRFSR